MTNTSTTQKQTCQTCLKEFLILPIEQTFYAKKDLPNPVDCPDCRHKRRASLRNENKLYRINCAKCEKSTLSTYRPDSPYTVYCKTCYYDSLI